MVRDLFEERCSQILAVGPELTAYEQWLRERRSDQTSRDYLFSETRPRFEPRKDDVVVSMPDLFVETRSGHTRLRCTRPEADLEIPGVGQQEAEKILRVIDGQRCLLEVRWDAGVQPTTLGAFLRATFGLVLFAPSSVTALEEALSGIEVTRFPGAPYGIDRSYWENMIDVRSHFLHSEDMLESSSRFERRLREMHVLGLMGRGLTSYYKPASPVADRVVAPGSLYRDPPRLLERARGTLFLDGPRVNVSLLGGEGYHRVLCASVGDEEALMESRRFEAGGVFWGQFVTARSEKDDHFGPWFCPPRPIREEHWDRLVDDLRSAKRAATAGDVGTVLQRAAVFHQCFVRLHPFHCANQSIAMNLINAVLGTALGAGIPHLVLDHLALRLSEQAYATVFSRAARAYSVPSQDSTGRLATLMDRTSKSFRVIEGLQQLGGQKAESFLNENPEGSRWALLVD